MQGFLVTSSSVLLFLEEYKKDALAVRIRGDLCSSLETKVAVTWQKWKEGQYRLCCMWAKHITVVDIFDRYLYYLSFLPSAAPPAKDFIYICAVRVSQVSVLASVRLDRDPLSFVGKRPCFQWPLESNSFSLRDASTMLRATWKLVHVKGYQWRQGGAGCVFTLST